MKPKPHPFAKAAEVHATYQKDNRKLFRNNIKYSSYVAGAAHGATCDVVRERAL